MNARKIEYFVIIAIIAIIGVIYAFTYTPDSAQAPVNDQERVQMVPSSSVVYDGVDGKNAMELLKASHRVETKSFSGIGEYVVSIDGVQPDVSHFWAFYVNGAQAQVGADQYVTKNGEKIEWKLEEIK